MEKQSLTGGILNYINEKYRCNSKKNTVPIMDLIRYHKPKQRDELVKLIEAHQVGHSHENCKCGLRSAGSIESFGKRLYEANLDFFKEDLSKAKSLVDCELFMYNLFVVQSLKGDVMEDKAHEELSEYDIRIATQYEDFNLGVDLVINHNNKTCGIQVKPISYKNMPSNHEVVKINKSKNDKFGHPVFYLYYDLENNFTNLDSVRKNIESL